MINFVRKLIAFSLGIIFWSLGTLAFANPVSIEIVGADVRTTLAGIARLGNIPLIVDDSVVGKITASLTGEPSEIIRLIARSKGIELERHGEVYIALGTVGQRTTRQVHTYTARFADPNDLAAAANIALVNAANETLLAGNAGRNTEMILPARNKEAGNASARAEEELIRRNLPEELPRVLVDSSTNTLLFYGTENEAREVLALMDALDIKPKQVALEAKVVAITKEAAKELGVNWSWSALPQYPDVSSAGEIRGRNAGSGYKGTAAPGIIRFGRGPLGVPYEFYYSATIAAMVTDGKAKLLARPNITTVQGKEAIINIGTEVPVSRTSTSDSVTTTGFEYREAGIILRYTPIISADGDITAKVHTEVSTPIYVDDLRAYRFQKRSADTTVRLRDGETMVIGGLIDSDESKIYTKVPFLGDMPIIGAFFRSVKTLRKEAELMIFLTARVL